MADKIARTTKLNEASYMLNTWATWQLENWMDRLSGFEKNRITQNKIDIYIVDNKTKLIQTTGGLQVGQIDFPELQTLSTQSHCPSVICYTSAPLILLHLIEHFKKAGQSTFVIRLWVFCARYWQRSMKECRQFCHFFKTPSCFVPHLKNASFFLLPSSKHSIKQTLCVPLIVERLSLSQEPLWSQRFLSRADRNLRQ